MGFLSNGKTLDWKTAKKHTRYVKDHGIIQLIQLYSQYKDVDDYQHLWGDEVEFIIVQFDKETKTVHLTVRGAEILHSLEQDEEKDCAWRPEYGVYMIEAIPANPYGDNLKALLQVQPNMKLRRTMIEAKCNESERVLSVTHFPRLGCPGFFYPDAPVNGPIARSKFVPDEIINPHRRFATLTNNILTRREKNVIINLPLFFDTNTKHISYDDLFPEIEDKSKIPAKADHVYADAMGFGMGMCCIQATFQLKNINEALATHDYLVPLAPIMLALTASTPILRGMLVDTDTRWHVIEDSVDDRNDEELGLKELKEFPRTIQKSRYSPSSSYIFPDAKGFKPEYNDMKIDYDEKYNEQLLSAGLPPMLAKHFAHLFIRDPLVIYEDRIEINDNKDVDHFENVQSSNWQSCRFKPPPFGTSIGWRVEFRTMELMFTDFENAAVVCFISLVVRMIENGNFENIYMPISLVNENMTTARKRGAVTNNKFWFKADASDLSNDSVVELTIAEIMNGHGGFKGLIPMVEQFVQQEEGADQNTIDHIHRYLSFLSQRADGTLQTNATWIRSFVRSHPSYQQDSVVNDEIAYDLLDTISQIEREELKVPALYGNFELHAL